MPSDKQKREADTLKKKKALAEKKKADMEKLRKEREIARKTAAKVAKEAKDRREASKAAAAAKKKEAPQQQETEIRQQQEKRGMTNNPQSIKKVALSPRIRGSKRDSASTTSSVTSAATQGERHRAKITDPPILEKKIGEDFETAIGLEGQREGEVSVGSGTKVPYTPNDLEPNNDTGRSIVDDAKFVTESVDMDFSKDDTKRDPNVLLQKVQDKILLCNTTPDDLDAIRFLTIIENFKVSNFGHIFGEKGFPSKAEHPEILGVKRLYRSTLAIRRIEMNLPQDCWFDEPWQMGPDQEQSLLSKYKAKSAAIEAAKNFAALKLKDSNEEEAKGADDVVPAGAAAGKETSLTLSERLKAANNQTEKDIMYKYWENYGQFGDRKPRKTGPYSKDIYVNAPAFTSYDIAHKDDSKGKKKMLDGMNAFDTGFEKSVGFFTRDKRATVPVITAFISKLLASTSSLGIMEEQNMMKLVYRFANTSPERFTSHWNYQSATLCVCPGTRLWLVANLVVGARWAIVLPSKLGPEPRVKPATTPKVGMKSGILNLKNRTTGILNRARAGTPASNRRTTTSGNFRFSPEVNAKYILSPTEEITSKAPRPHNTFVTIKTAPLDEGGAAGEKFVLKQMHEILENFWSVDPTLVLYPFPGKVQHSRHVLPYERRHTRPPLSRKYREIVSLQELKRYTDRVLVYTTKCSYINLFLGHSKPIEEVYNADVDYHVTNNQMRVIIKDIQAPAFTTVAWLVGMDPKTTNCADLTETLREYPQFRNLPIFVKIQQLKIEKTDERYDYGHPERTDVVSIQCAKHLRHTSFKACQKTFNSTKPRDVQNRPNGTKATCVEWWGDNNSPVPIRSKVKKARLAKEKHRKWLDSVVRMPLGMVKDLHIPLEIEGEGEINLHQVVMSLRSSVCYNCTIFQAVNKNRVTGDIIALCHAGYEEEASEIIDNLATLCIERFGQQTKRWFSQEAIDEANMQVYDRASNTIKVDEDKLQEELDIFASFGDQYTEADRQRAEMNGETLPIYEGGFDSDTSSDDEEPKQKKVFDLQLLIQLAPCTAGAVGMDDHNSIGTGATGLTNATRDIRQGVSDEKFDPIIDTDHITVVSAVTENTQYASPQHSKESSVISGNGSFRRGSSPTSSLRTPMDLEKTEANDNTAEGTNGRIDDSQEEGKSDHGQENDDDETMSEAEDHAKEGKKGGGRGGARGGRGRGRGEGSDFFSLQRERARQGGNYKHNGTDSPINPITEETTKTIVQNNNNIARSNSDQEQQQTAIGTTDNVSTSLRQTGVTENATG